MFRYYILEKYPPRSLVDPNLRQSATVIPSIVELKNREANHELIRQLLERSGGNTPVLYQYLSDLIQRQAEYRVNVRKRGLIFRI